MGLFRPVVGQLYFTSRQTESTTKPTCRARRTVKTPHHQHVGSASSLEYTAMRSYSLGHECSGTAGGKLEDRNANNLSPFSCRFSDNLGVLLPPVCRFLRAGGSPVVSGYSEHMLCKGVLSMTMAVSGSVCNVGRSPLTLELFKLEQPQAGPAYCIISFVSEAIAKFT